MKFVLRKITYRLYPNATQLPLLNETLALHCRAYNTLIEEHKLRHAAGEPPFNFSSMCRTLTVWRGRVDALSALNAQSLQVTAKRVSLAFDAFFRRIKEGDTPGFPRFKPLRRFAGWGYKTYGDGWKLRSYINSKGAGYDRVTLTGIGDIPMRGKGRFTGTPKTAEILHKAGKWTLSVTFSVPEYRIARPTGTEAAAFDWGLKTLLTLAKSDGTMEEIDNPRWLNNQLAAIKTLQRVISVAEDTAKRKAGLDPSVPMVKGQRFPVSAHLKRLYAQLRAIHGKVARQRKDFYHKLTTLLVERFAFLGTEELTVKNMTHAPAAKPDLENPGEFLPNGAAAKAGLNRGILDAAPSMLLGMLLTKAAEAASVFALANTRKVKPTQRCHCCGHLVKKSLSERVHRCSCRCVCGRDENAAKTLLRWMFEGDFWVSDPVSLRAGTVRAGVNPLETPPIAALAAWVG